MHGLLPLKEKSRYQCPVNLKSGHYFIPLAFFFSCLNLQSCPTSLIPSPSIVFKVVKSLFSSRIFFPLKFCTFDFGGRPGNCLVPTWLLPCVPWGEIKLCVPYPPEAQIQISRNQGHGSGDEDWLWVPSQSKGGMSHILLFSLN